MIRRLFTLCAVGVLVWLLLGLTRVGDSLRVAESTFVLGFVLLAAAMLGEIVEQLRLPRITGYILAGIVFGPNVAGHLSSPVMDELDIFNDMAYAFIGLAAGAELKLATFKARWRSITLLIALTTVVVMVGVGGGFFVAASFGGFLAPLSTAQLLALAGIVGVIAAARSPSSAIAIINETKAEGPFSETILGVSVAMDVIVICLFSVAMALAGLAFAPEQGLDLGFVLSVSGELVASVLLGVLLGLAIGLYLKRKGPQLPLVIVGLCFLVYRCSGIAARYLEEVHDVRVHLEPLLICAAAGFVIQNLSRQGARLAAAMETVSLPVYVVFFTLAGAHLSLDALMATWPIALVVVACRVVMIGIGTRLATTIAGDPPLFRRHAWLGFVTQAGLSLALIAQIEESFAGWGGRLATVLMAVVAVNQLVGPAAFKVALERVGEVRRGMKSTGGAS